MKSRLAQTGATGLAASALLLIACSAGDPLPRWEADGLSYFARSDDAAVCAEVLPRILTRLESYVEALNIPRPSHFDYYKYVDLDDLRAHSDCVSEHTGGCYTDAGEIHSPHVLHGHELVHAATGSLFEGRSPLEEGLASALSCDPALPLAKLVASDLAYDVAEMRPGAYAAWSALATELLRRGSISELALAHRLYLEAGADRSAMDAALSAIYGETSAQVFEALLATGASTCWPVGRCGQSRVEVGSSQILLACDGLHERVLGPELGPALGLAAGPSGASLFACDIDAPSFAAAQHDLEGAESHWALGVETLTLAPTSPYLLTTAATRFSEASLEVRTLAGAFARTCEESALGLLTRGPTQRMRIATPASSGDYWFHLATEGEEMVVAWADDPRESVSAWLCGNCPSDVATECAPISLDSLTFDTDSFLLLSNTADAPLPPRLLLQPLRLGTE